MFPDKNQVLCLVLMYCISSRSIVDYRDLDAPETMSLPQVDFERSIARRESSRAFGGVQK